MVPHVPRASPQPMEDEALTFARPTRIKLQSRHG